MKKCVICIGVPGTGKTTLARTFISLLEKDNPNEYFKESLVIGHKIGDVVVFGDYRTDDVFAGLDKASMAIFPEFKEYIRKNQPQNIFLEGDRLGSNSTIDFLMEEGYDVQVYVLEAPSEMITDRYKERGSDQNEKFLKSRETKVSNICSRIDLIMEDLIIKFEHKEEKDTKFICEQLKEYFSL